MQFRSDYFYLVRREGRLAGGTRDKGGAGCFKRQDLRQRIGGEDDTVREILEGLSGQPPEFAGLVSVDVAFPVTQAVDVK